ncbi:MAG: tetratricopeptide repeat protein, partial [Acidobacteriota bacterium]
MPTSRDQLLHSAEKHVSRGKLDQALKDYLRVLDDNPKDINTLNKVGDLYVRMNRPGDSIPFYTRIADFYARDGFFLKAIAIYKKINKIDPARLEVYDRLADLYHKQGLAQDARSQYQVLADHYLKTNHADEAIAAYKKMAAVDPNDLKIQVRLADLYRSHRQIDQAVMQYGLIGSMLLRRGAHDEAAAVFQKALELSPSDANIQRNLVRSLLAQKNPSAAIAILKAAPRTADSLALLAEAQLEMGQRAEAIRTIEQALALDTRHDPSRTLLSRLRVEEGSFDQALSAVLPLVDGAIATRDFPRAEGYLSPILTAHPAHRATLHKMAELREAEGNAGEAANTRLALGRDAEQRGDRDSAIENYRRILSMVPDQPDATARLRELQGETAPSAPGLEPRASSPLELPSGPDGPVRASSAAVAPPAQAEPAPARSPEEQEIETLVVEAEVFARYGLTDKAVERLRALVRRRPDLLRARERMVELMEESRNPALMQEADALAAIYRAAGDDARAETLASRLGLTRPAESPTPAPSPAAPSPRPTAPSVEIDFDEFDITPAAPPPAASPGDGSASAGNETIALPGSAVTTQKVPTPGFHAPAPESRVPVEEFVSYEELGSLLEEEMQKAGDAPASPAQPELPLDERSLFADEQQFFNLAEELEKELADEAGPPVAPDMAGPEGEVSLEEIFREFKKGVEQQLSAEDYDTHFNLGIAYKEMGLIDEGIGEFQLASKDPRRAVECCSMLGLCFLEKGMPQLAVKWYRKGLESPQIKEEETVGLLYDLACIYQST